MEWPLVLTGGDGGPAINAIVSWCLRRDSVKLQTDRLDESAPMLGVPAYQSSKSSQRHVDPLNGIFSKELDAFWCSQSERNVVPDSFSQFRRHIRGSEEPEPCGCLKISDPGIRDGGKIGIIWQTFFRSGRNDTQRASLRVLFDGREAGEACPNLCAQKIRDRWT